MRSIKRKIDTGLQGFFSAAYKGIKKIKKHPEEFYLRTACKSTKSNKTDAAFRLIPINADAFHRAGLDLRPDSFAIVMQGPIRVEDDFTIETVKYYRNFYPKAEIIVSTWSDENAKTLERVRLAGADVLLCEKPSSGGHLNINYQLKNSREGIFKAKERGVQYIAKTRTDQRISKPFIFEYMINLLKQYPSREPEKQNQRLVALSMNYGNMFYPYFMSDFFYFGTADEMSRLFSISADDRKPFKMPHESSKREYAKYAYAPEVFIMKNYMKSLGCSGDCTVKDYWEGILKYLVCVDMKTLDIYWPKYEGKYRLHEFYGDYFEDDSDEKLKTYNMDFVNWLNLYSGTLQYKPEYEKYADVIFK